MEEKNSAGMFPASGRGSDIEGFSSIQRFVLFRGYIRGAEQALRCRGQENPLSVFNKISKIHSHQSYNEPVSVNLRKIDFPKEQQAVAVNRRCSPLHTHKRTAHHSLSQNNWFSGTTMERLLYTYQSLTIFCTMHSFSEPGDWRYLNVQRIVVKYCHVETFTVFFPSTTFKSTGSLCKTCSTFKYLIEYSKS